MKKALKGIKIAGSIIKWIGYIATFAGIAGIIAEGFEKMAGEIQKKYPDLLKPKEVEDDTANG